MADIRQGLQGCDEKTKLLGMKLIEFYESMKALESDSERAGKQATLIVMGISDLESMMNTFHRKKNDPGTRFILYSNLTPDIIGSYDDWDSAIMRAKACATQWKDETMVIDQVTTITTYINWHESGSIQITTKK